MTSTARTNGHESGARRDELQGVSTNARASRVRPEVVRLVPLSRSMRIVPAEHVRQGDTVDKDRSSCDGHCMRGNGPGWSKDGEQRAQAGYCASSPGLRVTKGV